MKEEKNFSVCLSVLHYHNSTLQLFAEKMDDASKCQVFLSSSFFNILYQFNDTHLPTYITKSTHKIRGLLLYKFLLSRGKKWKSFTYGRRVRTLFLVTVFSLCVKKLENGYHSPWSACWRRENFWEYILARRKYVAGNVQHSDKNVNRFYYTFFCRFCSKTSKVNTFFLAFFYF